MSHTPKAFTRLEAESAVSYQTATSGSLDVLRLVNGYADHWISPAPAKKLRAKKLILTDWRALHWSPEKSEAIGTALECLMTPGENGLDEAFEIYLWQDGELKQLYKEEINSLKNTHVREALCPTDPDIMLKTATDQLGVAADELQLLDDYWIDEMLEDKESLKARELNFGEFLKANHELQSKVLPYLDKATPKLETLLVNPFASNELNQEKVFSRKVKRRFFASSLNMMLSDYQRLLESGSSSVDGPFTGTTVPLTLSEVAHCQTLKLSRNGRASTTLDLIQLFSQFKDLRKLNLGEGSNDSCQISTPIDKTALGNNNPLTEITNLLDEAIPLADFQTLIEAFPQLKKLGVSLCKALPLKERLSAGSLNKLEELILKKPSVPFENLAQFLKENRSLKRLRIETYNFPESLAALLEAGSLEHLEEITLSDVNISSTILRDLLKAAPKLRKINISSTSESREVLEFTEEIFALVEEFRFQTEEVFFTGNFRSLLRKFPNLKKLEVPNAIIGGKKNANLITPNCLAQLEVIDLSENYIDFYSLAKLLNAAPNLNKLILSKIDSIKTTPDFAALRINSLFKLKHLDLSNTTISAENLSRLLLVCPNLSSLDLSNAKLTGSDPTLIASTLEGLEPGCLSKLTEINLHNSKISISILGTLLKACPNIKNLRIDSCDFSSGDFNNLKPGDLTELEEINLKFTSISLSNLKALLKAAPKLKRLYINLHEHELDEELRVMLRQLIAQGVHVGHHPEPPLSVGADDAFDEEEEEEERSSASDLPEAVHNPRDFADFKPTSSSYEFSYRGKARTKSQDTLIEQFSQYCTLTNQHLALLPKAKDGICNTLAHYFVEKAGNLDILDLAKAWDGKKESLSAELVNHFEELREFIFKHQFGVNAATQHGVGDNLDLFLGTCRHACVLSNAWHAIAIEPPAAGTEDWTVYDPNYRNGPKKVKHSELLDEIRRVLIGFISIETSDPLPLAKIDDPRQFIQQGGLLALCKAREADATILLNHFSSPINFSANDLEGILIRDLNGYPAWARGFEKASTAGFTSYLLAQLNHLNPYVYKEKVQRSVAVLSSLQRHELITHIVASLHLFPTPPHHLVELIQLLRPVPQAHEYEHEFATWKKKSSLTGTLEEYCQECVASSAEQSKGLIECSSTQQVNALQVALARYSHKSHRPYFYANSPDDLMCANPSVYRQKDADGNFTNLGELHPHGGAFFDFLKRARLAGEPTPVIVVNYDNFEAEDIVRFNSLLDEVRKIDDETLATDMMVVGLINVNKANCYRGSDFSSRFNKIESCPFGFTALQAALPPLPTIVSAETRADAVINLFHANDWKERLVGRCTLSGQALSFEEGELIKTLRSHPKSLVIQNGLWENPNFLRFWQEARLKGYIDYAGMQIEIPDDLVLLREEGYHWDTLKMVIALADYATPSTSLLSLNPSTLGAFFSRFEVTSEEQLKPLIGHIEATTRGQVLELYVTRTLSLDAWAQLLTQCQKQGVTLSLHCAHGVELPEELNLKSDLAPAGAGAAAMPAENLSSPALVMPAWNKRRRQATEVIQSTDIDTTIARLKEDKSEWIVIDVSECNAADLLEKLSGGLDRTTLKFNFAKEDGVLLQALKAGKHIILKGRFSAELADDLANILVARQNMKELSGRLVLVSENADMLSYARPSTHTVSDDEKLSQLMPLTIPVMHQLEEFIGTEHLSQLRSRRDFLRENPGVSSDKAWIGIRDLKEGVSPPAVFDPATSAAESLEFTAIRKALVNRVLDRGPTVFISGLSGVGKSSFVTNIDEFKGPHDTLFNGEDKIEKWATATGAPEERFVLFLDEATLSKREWSEFEGLYETPPTLRIGSKLYPLGPQHKVIFAGNAVSYGDERHLAPFFERHGNAVLFKTMPAAVIYEKVLKAVFAQTPLEKEAATISAEFLKVYNFLAARSTKDVLISPRELQMMALLTLSHCYKAKSSAGALSVAKDFAYRLAQNLVPAEHKKAFDEAFKPESPLLANPEMPKSHEGFFITASREPLNQLLDELLSLRQLRQYAPDRHPAVRYGGLGGIIIEGEPGIGKSEMVTMSLVTHGYVQIHDHDSEATCPPKAFYRIPVNLSFDEKKRILLKAFNQGAIVVIDEINSSPMMEALFNELLMGFYKNKRPDNPGFMMIGTQNPAASMSGRRLASTALSRRLITTQLPAYTRQEMLGILKTTGLNDEILNALIDAYQKQRQHAEQKRLSPAPNFRDLLNTVERYARKIKFKPSGVMRISTEERPRRADTIQTCREAAAEEEKLRPPETGLSR